MIIPKKGALSLGMRDFNKSTYNVIRTGFVNKTIPDDSNTWVLFMHDTFSVNYCTAFDTTDIVQTVFYVDHCINPYESMLGGTINP